MSLHPFERFLGVPEQADPFVLLGLKPDHADALAVDEALRRRLAEVFRHPDGRSEDAEVVRAALREAADAIKRESRQRRLTTYAAAHQTPAWMQKATRTRGQPRNVAAPMFKLTAFDRLVLGALVACGGWNARSRAQLVALSQTYGVTVGGLLRVMKGLSEYARSGGPRIGVTDIADRGLPPPITPVSLAAPPPVGPALLDRLAENLGRELKRGGAWPTIKLAIIFGIATLVLGIIALRVSLNRHDESDGEQPVLSSADGSAASTADMGTGGASPIVPVIEAVRIARFPKQPTFLGNGLPADAVNAVDQLPGLPGNFDELARRISVANGEPSEAIYRQWQADIGTIAVSWAIGDASTRNAIDRAIAEALRAAADTPAVSDRLLRSLSPSVSVSEPLDLWRGTWMAGMLGLISSSTNLPPVVADRARSVLEISLSQNLRGAVPFQKAGDLWLEQRVGQLVQMLPFNEGAFDAWELWLSAERALGTGERYDAAIMFALRSILETEYDLSTPGPPVDAVGRLLDVALRTDSAIVRQRFLDFFDNQEITSRDLWVCTSLLAGDDRAGWFPDRLVVPEDADMALRWRMRDDLAKTWPVSASASASPALNAARPEFDANEAENWLAVVDAVIDAPIADDQASQLQQVVDASRLTTAAAALVAKIPEETRRLIREVADGSMRSAVPSSPPRPGQPIGADGAWAAAYGELGKNTESRLESLRGLRAKAGTDMGPIDAALLVKEAYRGSPQEVRTVAQAIIQEMFKTGPSVAMQLLDQFADAPAIESISELIQTVTGQLLPGVRGSTWMSEARLALVQHALELRDSDGAPIESLMEPLINSYADRLMLAKNDPSVTTTPSSPQEAAELLLRAMMTQAEFAAPLQPVPADLPSLQRRHNSRQALADGPIQMFVAQQLAILDVTAYLFVAEQPNLRDDALRILREHASTRARTASVLEQAVDIERATLELWRLRLGFDPHQVPSTAEKEEEP